MSKRLQLLSITPMDVVTDGAVLRVASTHAMNTMALRQVESSVIGFS
jgi:hypothetical protein